MSNRKGWLSKQVPQSSPTAVLYSLGGKLPSLKPLTHKDIDSPTSQSQSDTNVFPRQSSPMHILEAHRLIRDDILRKEEQRNNNIGVILSIRGTLGPSHFTKNGPRETLSIDYQLAKLREKRRKMDMNCNTTDVTSPSDAPPEHRPRNCIKEVNDIEKYYKLPTTQHSKKQNNHSNIHPLFEKEEKQGEDQRGKCEPVAVVATIHKRLRTLKEKQELNNRINGKNKKRWSDVHPHHIDDTVKFKDMHSPSLAERMRTLEEFILLIQGKGRVAKDLIASSVDQENTGNGKKGNDGATSVSMDWVFQDKGIKVLKTEVLERWLMADEEALRLCVQRADTAIKKASKRSGIDGNGTLLCDITAGHGGKNHLQASCINFNTNSIFDSNLLVKSFVENTLGLCGSPCTMVTGKSGTCEDEMPREGVRVSPSGYTMYYPDEKEVVFLLSNVTHIIRALMSCIDNGRSNVSKAAAETMGLLASRIGLMRAHTLLVSNKKLDRESDPNPQIHEAALVSFLQSPTCRALDIHADSIIKKLIVKGGSAGVKFLFPVAANGLYHVIMSVGSGNTLLISTLIHSMTQNPPRTDKSRILWADAVSLALMSRWSAFIVYTSKNSKGSLDMHSVQPLACRSRSNSNIGSNTGSGGVGAHLAPFAVASVLFGRMITARGLDEQNSSSDQNGIIGALRHFHQYITLGDSGDSAISSPPVHIPTSIKEMTEIILKMVPMLNLLFADGCRDVRESGKMCMFALVVLAEEHKRVYGYGDISPGNYRGGKIPPVKGGAGRQEHSSTVPSVPTIESVIRKIYVDSKLKQERLLDALRVVTEGYWEDFDPALSSSLGRLNNDTFPDC